MVCVGVALAPAVRHIVVVVVEVEDLSWAWVGVGARAKEKARAIWSVSNPGPEAHLAFGSQNQVKVLVDGESST